MRSHVALEVQCDMAGAQCDMARSFGSLLGSFGAFGLEPRRVGSPTRHGGGPIRRGALFRLTFGLFCHLGRGATSCWRSNVTWRGPMRHGARFFGSLFGCFAAFEVEPRRVGGLTRHGGGPMRRDTLFLLPFGCFGPFELEPRRVGGPTRHGRGPIRHGALVFLPFGLF